MNLSENLILLNNKLPPKDVSQFTGTQIISVGAGFPRPLSLCISISSLTDSTVRQLPQAVI
jgi:hypothetical protein